jgi:NTE family protein
VPTHGKTDDLHWPISFAAQYGKGLDRAICFGGGGVFFVAWQIAYLKSLSEANVELNPVDRVIGTSAGSIVATLFTSGRANDFYGELALLAKVPALIAALAPSGDLHASPKYALQLFQDATTGDPEAARHIGHAALAAQTPSPTSMRRNLALVVRQRSWPSPALHTSTVDTLTGDRCIVTDSSQVPVPAALAASTAIPGVFPPQQIGDRKCMDGGICGTGTHLDVLAGSKRALVLSLRDLTNTKESGMTQSPAASKAELDALTASGTKVFRASPEHFTLAELMSPTAVSKAMEMGSRQGADDAERFGNFWNDK